MLNCKDITLFAQRFNFVPINVKCVSFSASSTLNFYDNFSKVQKYSFNNDRYPPNSIAFSVLLSELDENVSFEVGDFILDSVCDSSFASAKELLDTFPSVYRISKIIDNSNAPFLAHFSIIAQ